ncbi:putative RNA-directed DNA polymerase, eukaryota, reverse transcriptase zinc-binding domain protein [Tanacetum coccineum]
MSSVKQNDYQKLLSTPLSHEHELLASVDLDFDTPVEWSFGFSNCCSNASLSCIFSAGIHALLTYGTGCGWIYSLTYCSKIRKQYMLGGSPFQDCLAHLCCERCALCQEYRELIGCVYKFISNILSNRLAKVISLVIGPNQTAFIAGRQIIDGCLIANDIIRMASTKKSNLLLFKVDFEKAFDSVNWNFLQNVMRQMGLALNGENGLLLAFHQPPSRSSLMALQISILEACEKGFFKGIHLANNGANISLLQYADDALFFGDWSRTNAMHLIHILKCFEVASGLKVNMSKSILIGLGISMSEVENMANFIGWSHDSVPFIYLDLSVGKRMRFVDGWGEVKWESILCDVDKGGLEVGSLMAKNLSLLCNWKWRFYAEKNALWCQVIKDFYGADRGLSSPSNSCGICGTWCDILKAIENIEVVDNSFKNPFVLKVSSESNSLFWKDPWCGNGHRLMDIYPRLFALDVRKDCKINERWSLTSGVWGGNWSWRIPPRGRALGDLSSLISRIGDLHLPSNGCDKWTWSGDESGSFKVRNLVKSIESQLLSGYVIGKHHQ